MVDRREIQEEIARLEAAGTTYTNCEKLAMLHTVLDHYPEEAEKRPRNASETLRRSAGYSYSSGASEFLTAAAAVEIKDLLEILDEHMEALQIVYPKEYQAIIKKLWKTHN